MSESEVGATAAAKLCLDAEAIWAQVQQIEHAGHVRDVSNETIQNLLTAALKLFSAKIDTNQKNFSPVLEGASISATEVAVLTVELMHVVDLNLFDLSMWASRPRD
jgi:hypothetical protein